MVEILIWRLLWVIPLYNSGSWDRKWSPSKFLDREWTFLVVFCVIVFEKPLKKRVFYTLWSSQSVYEAAYDVPEWQTLINNVIQHLRWFWSNSTHFLTTKWGSEMTSRDDGFYRFSLRFLVVKSCAKYTFSGYFHAPKCSWMILECIQSPQVSF